MQRLFKKHKTTLVLTILIILSVLLHFYNLDWGSPYYFHPDERNIASSVNQLQFPSHMNPNFFAYGSLPIYVIYFTGIVSNALFHFTTAIATPSSSKLIVDFNQAIIISRFYSAIFATLLIPLLFVLGRRLKNEWTGLLAAFFTTCSVGFIQFAHFGTFEMWLTFFSVLLFWLCLLFIKKPTDFLTFLIACVFGILVATKVSSLALLPIPLFVFALRSRHDLVKTDKGNLTLKQKIRAYHFLTFCKNVLFFVFVATFVYLIANPYVILDGEAFLSSMHYESGVAVGTIPVFYTDNFIGTVPVVYQLLYIYPFLINPIIGIAFILSFVLLFYHTIKKKRVDLLLLIIFFLLLFFSEAFLFVKWTRYMTPTLPFIYLITAIYVTKVFAFTKKHKNVLLRYSLFGIFILLPCIIALSYFKTAFLSIDTRIAGVAFAKRVIPVNATILSEPSDLGILPFQDAFAHISTFDFYDLDNNSPDATVALLQQKVMASQYIILPSQRILQSRIANPKKFPNGNTFYSSLFSGKLGFQKIYETPCDIFCKITYLGDPVYWFEQTTNVFDRPTIFIFKKV